METIHNNALARLHATLQFILSMIIVTGFLGGCVTARKVDPPTLSKYEGFLRDGNTKKREIQDRLGPAQSVYENGRILVYHVYLQDDAHMNLNGTGTCHACVLVFGKDDVLELHSLVKHGCH